MILRHSGMHVMPDASHLPGCGREEQYVMPDASHLTKRSLLSPTVSDRKLAFPSGSERFCSECSISEVRANFRNSSEFFRAYSDQFRATGRNHSDMIRTYSEQIPSKFLANSDHIRAF